MIVYVDSSALAALIVEQPESGELEEWLDGVDGDLVACDLLETELRRVAVREGIDQSDITKILDGVSLASLDRAAFRSAGMLPFQNLRALDALHLQAALLLQADAVLTYDHRMAEAAVALGFQVFSPGHTGNPGEDDEVTL